MSTITLSDLDIICEISEMPKICCSLSGPRHFGCAGVVQAPVRGYSFGAPLESVCDVTLEIAGKATTWYPNGTPLFGTKDELDPDSGHVHIAGGYSLAHVYEIIAKCERIYLITAAPTQMAALKRAKSALEARGIGAHALRLRGIQLP